MKTKLETLVCICAPALALIVGMWLFTLMNNVPAVKFLYGALIALAMIILLAFINKKKPKELPVISATLVLSSAYIVILLAVDTQPKIKIAAEIMLLVVLLLGAITIIRSN